MSDSEASQNQGRGILPDIKVLMPYDKVDVYVHFIGENLSKVMKVSGCTLFNNPLNELSFLFNAPTYQAEKFATEKHVKITPEKRASVENFVARHVDDLPALHRLRKIFNELEDDSHILVLPSFYDKKLPLDVFNNFYSTIEYMNTNDKTALDKAKEFDEFAGSLISSYEIFHADGSGEWHFGESDKSRRICRYCGKRAPEVSFRKKAHAISEGLGNKKIITNTECDKCNDDFGKTIEKSLIDYLQFWNVFSISKARMAREHLSEKMCVLKKHRKALLRCSSIARAKQGRPCRPQTFSLTYARKWPCRTCTARLPNLPWAYCLMKRFAILRTL